MLAAVADQQQKLATEPVVLEVGAREQNLFILFLIAHPEQPILAVVVAQAL
jgi:hypothetical protein